jgi:uncharacterized lipoprotein YajG
MKKTLLLVAGLILMASCSAPQILATENISKELKREREAFIYEDKVVIVTRTTLTPMEYALMLEKTRNNRGNLNE